MCMLKSSFQKEINKCSSGFQIPNSKGFYQSNLMYFYIPNKNSWEMQIDKAFEKLHESFEFYYLLFTTFARMYTLRFKLQIFLL